MIDDGTDILTVGQVQFSVEQLVQTVAQGIGGLDGERAARFGEDDIDTGGEHGQDNLHRGDKINIW